MTEESAPAPTTEQVSHVKQGPQVARPAEPKDRGRRLADLAIGSTFLIPGLAISGWSMFSYMRESTDAPLILCLGASAAFDGIGLYAAKKANLFASQGRKAKFAWFVVWAAVVASVVINWRHASTQHWNTGIHLLISSPSAAAAAAFEIMMQETREVERSKHEKRVRTRQSVKIDYDIWLHHPLKVWGARREESAARLAEALDANKPPTIGQPDEPITVIESAPVSGTAIESGQTSPREIEPAPMSAPPALPAGQSGAGRRRAGQPDTDGARIIRLPGQTPRTAGQPDDGWTDIPVSGAPGTDSRTDTDNGARTARTPDAGKPAGQVHGRPGQPGQRTGGDVPNSRTSGTDTPDKWSELVEGLYVPGEPAPGVAQVVRHVYREDWDTATMQRIVSEVLPDAKADTIAKTIRRVRGQRDGQATGTDSVSGNYM